MNILKYYQTYAIFLLCKVILLILLQIMFKIEICKLLSKYKKINIFTEIYTLKFDMAS